MEYNKSVIEQLESYCMSKPMVYETRPFGPTPICYRVMGKIFAQMNPEENFFKMTLKTNPERAELYRHMYPQVVVRGYHCPPVQQPYWNTIDLNQFEDMDMLCQMIDEAYAEIVSKLTRKDKARLSSELSEIEFVTTDGENSDFAMLCVKLDEALDELVGNSFDRTKYTPFNGKESIHTVIVAYKAGRAVACGGYKMFDEEHAELKRIYIDPACRGMGLGAELVRRLEAKARIDGYRWCVLETGEPLAAACHLYQKMGYKVIPNYGPYVDMEDSICMQRKI